MKSSIVIRRIASCALFFATKICTRYMSERVVDMVASLDKVCECFLVPFQSGSDAVLRRMRRGYTYDSYIRIIDRIKRLVPDASICGDVIVGFPGTLGSNILCAMVIVVVVICQTRKIDVPFLCLTFQYMQGKLMPILILLLS